MGTKALTADDLIFEIHKASPASSVRGLRALDGETLLKIYRWSCRPDRPVRLIRDERMYDNKGNVVPDETGDGEPDVLEPYDMEYLKDKSGSGFRLSRTEEHFMACVRKLEDELKRRKVRFGWYGRWRCFRIYRYVSGSEFPTYRYVGYDAGNKDFFYGTEDEDIEYGRDVKVVVEAAYKWQTSEMVLKRKRAKTGKRTRK